MKRIHALTLSLLALVTAAAIAGPRGSTADFAADGPAAPLHLVPARAVFCLRGTSMNRAREILKFHIEKTATPAARERIARWKNRIYETTGIDLLDPRSTESAGLHGAGPLAVASLPLSPGSLPDQIVCLPVASEHSFYRKMADALRKRRAPADDSRAHPVSRFRDYTVYRLAPDMFVSVAGRFCVIASSLPLLRESLDLAAQQSAPSLAADALFIDSIRRGMPDSEIGIFIRKERVERMNGVLRGLFGDDRPVSADTKNGHSSVKPSFNGEIRPVYAGAGIRMSGSSLRIKLIASLDESDPLALQVLDMFAVPERQECAFSENYLFFMHLYFNAGPLSRACAEERYASSAPCGAGAGLRSILENYTEIEIDDDLIGSHAGFIDLLMRKSAAADIPDETLLYLPLRDADSAGRLWKKLRDRCRQKYRDDDAFGRERILDKPLFWIKDQNDSRTYYSAHENALFVGNSRPLMEKIMRERKRELSEVCGLATGGGMDAGTFALASIDLAHSRIMKAFLQLSAYKVNLMLYSLLDVTDTFNFTGRKDGSAFVLDFILSLNPGAVTRPEK